MYIYGWIYISIVYIQLDVYIHMYVYTYCICVRAHLHTRTHTHTPKRTHAHTRTRTNTHIQTHTRTHTHGFLSSEPEVEKADNVMSYYTPRSQRNRGLEETGLDSSSFLSDEVSFQPQSQTSSHTHTHTYTYASLPLQVLSAEAARSYSGEGGERDKGGGREADGEHRGRRNRSETERGMRACAGAGTGGGAAHTRVTETNFKPDMASARMKADHLATEQHRLDRETGERFERCESTLLQKLESRGGWLSSPDGGGRSRAGQPAGDSAGGSRDVNQHYSSVSSSALPMDFLGGDTDKELHAFLKGEGNGPFLKARVNHAVFKAEVDAAVLKARGLDASLDVKIDDAGLKAKGHEDALSASERTGVMGQREREAGSADLALPLPQSPLDHRRIVTSPSFSATQALFDQHRSSSPEAVQARLVREQLKALTHRISSKTTPQTTEGGWKPIGRCLTPRTLQAHSTAVYGCPSGTQTERRRFGFGRGDEEGEAQGPNLAQAQGLWGPLQNSPSDSRLSIARGISHSAVFQGDNSHQRSEGKRPVRNLLDLQREVSHTSLQNALACEQRRSLKLEQTVEDLEQARRKSVDIEQDARRTSAARSLQAQVLQLQLALTIEACCIDMWYLKMRERKRNMRSVCVTLARKRMRAALKRWQHAMLLVRMRRKAQLFSSCASTYKAWEAWHHIHVTLVEHLRCVDASHATGVSQKKRQLLTAVIRGWARQGKTRFRLNSVVHSRKLRKTKSLYAKAVGAWRQRCAAWQNLVQRARIVLSQALNQWQIGISEKRLLSLNRIRVIKFVEHSARASQTLSLSRWRKAVRDKRQLYFTISIVLRRVIPDHLQWMLAQWCTFADEKARLRKIASGLVLKAMCACVRSMIAHWRRHWRVETQLRAAALLHLNRWSKGLTLKYVFSWRRTTQYHRQMRAYKSMALCSLQRAIIRMRLMTLFAVLLRWREAAYGLRRQRGVMKRVALRMRNAGMFTALQRWRENCTEKKAMVAKSTKVVLRWKLQAVVRCLEAWRELTAEEVRKRDLMGRIVGRMRQRSLTFAMDLLQQNVSAARQERAEEERRQNIVSRVVRRMLNQAQAGALERWSTSVSELARQRDIMDRMLRRMLNAKMAAGQTKPMFRMIASCPSGFVSF